MQKSHTSDDTAPDTPIFGRDAVLISLNSQLEAITQRFKGDVGQIRAQNKLPGTPPAVFLTYNLRTMENEPLSEQYLTDFDINLKAIENTDNYKQLMTISGAQELEVFLDYYVNYASKKTARPSRYVRMIIEGWE